MRRFGWVVLTLLAMAIALYAAAVLFVPGFGPPFIGALREQLPAAVVAHIGGGVLAMSLGPWQFSARLRARAVNLHRWMGRVYVAGVLIGGLGGLALAPASQEGPVTHVGFGMLAVLWLVTTTQAWRMIRAGDSVSHRRWMVRSFALTLAAVTLRIILPIELALGMDFHDAYQVVSWLCWVPNLVVAEWILLAPPARMGRVAA